MIKKSVNKKDWEISIIVPSSKELWIKKQKDAVKDLSKNLKVKGFRPGKATPEIAKKHLNNFDIQKKAAELIANDLVKIAAENIDKNLIVLDSAVYDIEKVSDVELELKFTYPIYPEFKIKTYKNLGLEIKKEKVTSKEINAEIEKIREKNALLINKTNNEGKAELNDIVNINYIGKIENKEFEGGKADNYELKLGSKTFVDNFEEQLLGHKAGEQVEIKVTFPEDYQSKDLAKKDAIFNVKINNVFISEKPKLDDSLTKLVSKPKVKTLKELKDYYKNLLIEEKSEKSRIAFKQTIFEKIIKENDIPIPRLVLMKETANAIKEFEDNISKYNFTIDKYLKMLNMDKKELVTKLNEESQIRLREALIYTEISKQEKIGAVDEDYDKEYEKFSKLYNVEVETIKGMITKEQLQVSIVNNKVLNYLIENNSKPKK